MQKASKSEATIYTAGAGAAGAYAGLRGGEAFGKAHAKAIAEDVVLGGKKIPLEKYRKESPMQYAARVSKKVKRFGAVVGGVLGAGVAANYFIRKNI